MARKPTIQLWHPGDPELSPSCGVGTDRFWVTVCKYAIAQAKPGNARNCIIANALRLIQGVSDVDVSDAHASFVFEGVYYKYEIPAGVRTIPFKLDKEGNGLTGVELKAYLATISPFRFLMTARTWRPARKLPSRKFKERPSIRGKRRPPLTPEQRQAMLDSGHWVMRSVVRECLCRRRRGFKDVTAYTRIVPAPSVPEVVVTTSMTPASV